MTILDVIENEIVARYGPYQGPRIIVDGDPIIYDSVIGKEDPIPDYVIQCSKYVLEGLYGSILGRGFMMKTFYTPDYKPDFSSFKVKFLYQLPKLGVIQIVPTLSQGYVIEKVGINEQYKLEAHV